MARTLVARGGAFVAIALMSLAGACVGPRPIGDFGRAQPSALHDEALPAIGHTRAQLAGEPASSFNLTDQEREMHDRVWRFLIAPHAHDWFYDFSVELQRTRLSGPRDHKFAPERYYRWLHQTEFSSSRTRYAAVADHIQADLDTMPATFLAICAVIEVDRQRGVASREVIGIGPQTRDHAAARHAENEMKISWFVRAATYRFDSYGYALDHLLVETPHEEAIEVDARLSELSLWVEFAQRGEFCSGGGFAVYKDRDRGGALPSRFELQAGSELVYRK